MNIIKDISKTNLVDWINDPVDTRISANGLVTGINKNDLKIFIC